MKSVELLSGGLRGESQLRLSLVCGVCVIIFSLEGSHTHEFRSCDDEDSNVAQPVPSLQLYH